MSAPSGLRLFGVTEVDHGSDPVAAGTTLIHHRGLAAIVEPANYTSPKPTDTDLERYAVVIEEAFRAGAVLPAPPGTVFKSHGTLSHWLELHYFTLTDAMTVVEDHVAARVSISAAVNAKEEDGAKSFKALSAESLRHFRGHAAATVVIPVTKTKARKASSRARRSSFPRTNGIRSRVSSRRRAGVSPR
jgi:Gas vesicle synthesis protein GvpL/GvpF.